MSLNQLNYFYQFKVNLFVHGAGQWSIQKTKRLLEVVSLSFGLGETNCSQGGLSLIGLGIIHVPVLIQH